MEQLWPALDDWEKYLHDERPQLPLLIRCALLHYQFETIHPFLDGNGGIGRLFIVLYLMDQGRLPAPLLYLFSYFDQRKPEYYDRLQFLRERGEVLEWLQFFLAGVAVQANDAVERAEQLGDLRERYRETLRGNRSRAGEVVDLLFAKPDPHGPVRAGPVVPQPAGCHEPPAAPCPARGAARGRRGPGGAASMVR